MSIRLNAEKRTVIMHYINEFLTDAETQERYCIAVRKVLDLVEKEILSRFPQDEMMILDKYKQATFGWDEYKIYLKGSNGYYAKSDVFDLPLYYPKDTYVEIVATPETDALFAEFFEAKRAYYKKVDDLRREYERFVNAAYSVEAVIELIPWLQEYFGKIAKETSCKVSEETIKKILANEAKRAA